MTDIVHIRINHPVCQTKTTPGEGDAGNSLGEVIDFPKSQLDWIFSANGPYQRKIRERATALRQFAQEIECRALTGRSGALDWLSTVELPVLEQAITEVRELRVLGRQYGLTRR
jgi:hypothetical protein